MMLLPLLARWRIRADELPDRLLDMDRPAPAFSLPGANALADFADLLGNEGDEDEEEASLPQAEDKDAPFPLPAMLPGDVAGEAELSLDVDFGALLGDRAVLTLDEIIGSGEILLGSEVIARFGGSPAERAEAAASLTAAPCMIAADLTDALRRGRKETLAIRFDEARPAGVPAPVFLRTSSGGWLSDLAVLPDALSKTMTVRALIHAGKEGRYILRVSPKPERPGDPLPPAREISCALNPMESRECALALAVPGDAFAPGAAYRHAALRIELLYVEGKAAVPCDSALVAAGYRGKAAPCFVPLNMQDMRGESKALIARLSAMHVSGVSLPAPAAEGFYLAAARAGVSVRHFMPAGHPAAARLMRHPCVSIRPLSDAPVRHPVSLEETAWQLSGVTGMERRPDPDFPPAVLLLEAAGRALDASDEGVRAVLHWLSAVAVRLRAEAARQQRFSGALCAPGQWAQEDIADAIRTALAPCHLSALPLLGAWWTGTRFSAALEAFIPEETAARHSVLTASAVLEDDEGRELARAERPFLPRRGGAGAPVGVIDAMLPGDPCVLTLTCRILSGDDVLEENTLPVYVGLRGPLEAAF